MSFTSSDLNPNDPLYYAPRRWRYKDKVLTTPDPETPSERLKRSIPSPSQLDVLLEEVVAQSLQLPLNSDAIPEPAAFEHEGDRRRVLLGVVGRFAAAVGVAAVVAFLFVFMIPATHGNAPQASGATASITAMFESIRTTLSPGTKKGDPSELILSEYRTILASAEPRRTASTPEEAEVLLQRFLEWQQRPSPSSRPIR
jgi:hypothetical protein